MKLFLLEQTYNNGYDTYDSCVVVAENEEFAKQIPPSNLYQFIEGDWAFVYHDGTWKHARYGAWAPVAYVKATLLGDAANTLTPGTVVCASFNAG